LQRSIIECAGYEARHDNSGKGTIPVDNLVFACVSPHGALIIPLVSGSEGAKARAGQAGMEELRRRMEAARPETIVILETHSIQVDGAIALLDSAQVRGELGTPHTVVPPEAAGHQFSLPFDVDRELNVAIMDAARAVKVPVVRVRHFLETTPLKIEWGSLIPLWYLGATLIPQPKVVIAGVAFPRNQVSREAYIDFGRALHTVIAASGKRVAVIISTDLAHTHEASGRYGFDPAAAECDAALLEVVRANSLERLLEFDEDWVDRAKNEAIRPLLTLHGLLEGTGSRVDLLSYEAPTYYGMMCAAYDRPPSDT
jgi:aromatic ring-opening dioxygenase LigB subunit